jgi:hypothetical protein
MNKQEDELDNAVQSGLPIILAVIGAIYYFVDPFDQKRRQST